MLFVFLILGNVLIQLFMIYFCSSSKRVMLKTMNLSDRSQTVTVDGCLSSFTNINTGVPQGSVLGPLLFLFFISDLPVCLGKTRINNYADDTAILVCGTDFKNIQKILQEEVDKAVKWFHSNRLVNNNIKCCCMIISSHPNQNTLDIYIDDVKISQVDSTKYFFYWF